MVIEGGSWGAIKFPSIVGVLQHPTRGWVLFDTGYAQRFIDETARFPEKMYRMITPVHLCDTEKLAFQLSQLGISAEDISYVFISHFHADHIAGLADFPKAKFICSERAAKAVIHSSRLGGLVKGYLPRLLPHDFLARCVFIERTKKVVLNNQYAPFRHGYDMFNDGSCLAISLPGHAVGHYGLMVESQGRARFLVADACWTRRAYIDGIKPNRLAHIIMDNRKQYLESLNKLSALYLANNELHIIPSHCQESFEEFCSV